MQRTRTEFEIFQVCGRWVINKIYCHRIWQLSQVAISETAFKVNEYDLARNISYMCIVCRVFSNCYSWHQL